VSGRLAGLSIKGNVIVYKIKDPENVTIDSCMLEWQASIADVIKQRSALSNND